MVCRSPRGAHGGLARLRQRGFAPRNIMRLLIAAVGKLKQEPERELVAHYLGRAASAGRALGFAHFDAIEIPESKAATAALRAQAEAAVLLAKSTFAHHVVALDPRGDQLDSEAFASMLGRLRDDGKPGLTIRDRRRGRARKRSSRQGAAETVAGRHDTAARPRPRRACGTDLPCHDNPCRASLSPCRRRPRLRVRKQFALICPTAPVSLP